MTHFCKNCVGLRKTYYITGQNSKIIIFTLKPKLSIGKVLQNSILLTINFIDSNKNLLLLEEKMKSCPFSHIDLIFMKGKKSEFNFLILLNKRKILNNAD